MKTNDTREQWLQRAVGLMTPLFKSKGYEVPKVRVSCGWPSSRCKSKKNRVLGECWSTTAAEDKISQIFVTPMYKATEVCGGQGVLSVLVHEVVHAVVGVKEKHNKVFGKCARAVGLEGKLTSTSAGDVLLNEIKAWAKSLGPYPHAGLTPGAGPVKKQTTRMVKCECPKCGYLCRTSRQWIDDMGAPHCPEHGVMAFEIPKELGGDDE